MSEKKKVKEIGRFSKLSEWICKCGKEALIHKTYYEDEYTCVHLYFCNDCSWEYDKKPRSLPLWQIEQMQKDIQEWNKRVYGK